MTASEASGLAGDTFGAGKEEAFSGNGKGCVYGYQTMNVFTVEVAQAFSAVAAQADFSNEQAKAQAVLKQGAPAGVDITLNTGTVANLGDRAATVNGGITISGQTIGVSGIYVLKGAIFFAFQDLEVGHSPASSAAMEAEARTVISRLP